MPKPRISFFVHDLAANPIARAAPLAKALQGTFDVEVVGFLFSGDSVYEPYRTRFEYHTLRCSRDVTSVLLHLPRLARLARGDVIYACKPLLTSLGPALVASGFGRRRPLLLDAEDDEWVPAGSSGPEVVWRDLIRGWRHATAWKYTRLLHPFTSYAHATTVTSRKLQRRYGGTIVLHGPDEREFDPSRPDIADPQVCRRRFGLPAVPRLALFAGTPQPHKGWEELLGALERRECLNWALVLAGSADHPGFQQASRRLGARCHVLGPVSQSEMPALLSAVDTVPVPQSRRTFAESQIPAKALEAMAMGLPVIAGAVGDLPELLGYGSRGWLCEPGNAGSLAAAFAALEADAAEARRRGASGREWYLQNASATAIRARVVPLVQRALLGLERGHL